MKRNLHTATLRAAMDCASRLVTSSRMLLKCSGVSAERRHIKRRLLATSRILLTSSVLWLPEKTFGVGHWYSVSTNVADNIGLIMLLSDGTVLAEGSGANWWQLTPGGNGHYTNGMLTARISSAWGHQTGSTAVLTNGNVYVGGGENGNGTNKVEIYNPVTGLWSTAVTTAYFGNILDGNAMLLANGQVLIEPQGQPPAVFNGSSSTYTFNPVNNQFSQTAGAPLNGIAEAAWVKLPNENILVIDSDNSPTGARTAEYYNPYTGYWSNAVAGGTVPNIWPNVTGSGAATESGPAFLLPNGNAIFFGGNLITAVYDNGIWSAGASLNNGEGMKDAPGAMMVNGKILLAVSPQGVNSAGTNINGTSPTSFYEYDYTANGGTGGFVLAPNPPGNPMTNANAGAANLLDLPDGTVLMSDGTGQLYVYQPDGSPLPEGQPNINTVQWNSNGSLTLTGTLFNGISGGAAFGDDAQMDSNFPLVSFTSGSTVYYGYTYNWNCTSVQAFGRIVTTQVNVPPAVLDYPGQWSLQVIANGIASPGVTFYSPVWVDFNLDGEIQFGWYPFPYYTLPQAVSDINSYYPGGTIAIRGDVQPSTGNETVPYTISTPMTIISVSGPSTIQ